MKAKLTFKLPKDYAEYKMTTNASNMHSVLWDLQEWLYSTVKDDDITREQRECYRECLIKLGELLKENQIELQ
jgi:hypothetical protein